MYYTIYETTNIKNGKKYRGKHKTKDLNDGYLGSGKYLKRAISKYGKDKFVKEIIFMAFTEEDMNFVERHYFVDSDWLSGATYNIKIGGEGGGNSKLVATIDHGLVDIEEFWENKEMYTPVAKNKIPVKDKNGKTFSVSRTDERLKMKELIPCLHLNGTINCINDNGDIIKVNKDEYDPTIHLHLSLNKVTVKDKNGKTFSVSRDDPRYISGELVGVTKGQSYVNSVYDIFDNEQNLVYTCVNKNFQQFLKEHGLPSVLHKSSLAGGSPIYQRLGSNKSRLEQQGMLKYVGWYCKRRN